MITWPYLILLLILTILSMDKGVVCHDWQSMYWVHQLPSLHHPLLGAWFTRISSCQCSKNPWKITHPMKTQVLILLDATLPVGSGGMVTSYRLMKAVSMMMTRGKMFLRLQLIFLYNTRRDGRCFSGCNWGFCTIPDEKEYVATESSVKYLISLYSGGQKTGYYLNQRENRLMVAELCKDKWVFNLRCYNGGFVLSSMLSIVLFRRFVLILLKMHQIP